MKRSIALCVALMGAAAASSQAATIPVEAYGQVEAVSQVSINPGGTHLAWAANDGKETQITVFEIASRKIVRNFKPLSEEERRRVETSTLKVAGDGRYELFKSSKMYDGPVHRKQHGFDTDTKAV